jgi:nitronate monooxygenase
MVGSRRDFLQQASALLAALGLGCATSGPEAVPMPTPRARELLARFGLRYPIFSAGMGGPGSAELAAAVSNGGGLGAVGTGATASAEIVRDRVARARLATDRLFAVNYLLTWNPVTLPIALDAGAPVIQFAWGLPGREDVAAIRRAGAQMGIQVSSADGARQALDLGVDYLICQGTEAGGHVQATRGLYEVLPAVIAEAGDVPVLAAGGITTGGHIRSALTAGASGVLMGTRFIATREAASHDDYKAALVRASAAEETVLTVCFQDGWINAPHRVLRNPTLERWEAAGCPPPGKRPGEGDVVAVSSTGAERRRYATTSPRPGDHGALLDLALYAGAGVSGIRDVPSAGELVGRLWDECLRSG